MRKDRESTYQVRLRTGVIALLIARCVGQRWQHFSVVQSNLALTGALGSRYGGALHYGETWATSVLSELWELHGEFIEAACWAEAPGETS